MLLHHPCVQEAMQSLCSPLVGSWHNITGYLAPTADVCSTPYTVKTAIYVCNSNSVLLYKVNGSPAALLNVVPMLTGIPDVPDSCHLICLFRMAFHRACQAFFCATDSPPPAHLALVGGHASNY